MPSPEGPELVADEVRRRHEHDRDRLRHDLSDAELDERSEDPEVSPVHQKGDDEEAQTLIPEVPAMMAEGPEPVQEIVVGDRDEEGAGRRDAVMEIGSVEQGDVDEQVDDVAGRPDDAELGELLPVVAREWRGRAGPP